MEREPTTEELINKIALLEKTLQFYGNQNNYPNLVIKDNGLQARFALDQIKSINSYEDDMIEKLKKALTDEGKDIETSEVNDVIEKLTKINKLFDNI